MTQIKKEVFNQLIGVTDSVEAPAKLLEILYDRPRREQLMKDVLEATNYQVDDDTFRLYFVDNHADRKYLKQDFTPHSVSKLVTQLVGTQEQQDNHTYYEACAGTGSMIISVWHNNVMKHELFTYKPSMYLYHVEELSSRAIPFLLFNLAMRGMNAIVVHCDVLSRQAYGAFFIQNDTDDPMQFSSINRLPYNDVVANSFGYPVEFVAKYYEPLIELPEHIPHLAEEMDRLQGKTSNTGISEPTVEQVAEDLMFESDLLSNPFEQPTYIQQSLF